MLHGSGAVARINSRFYFNLTSKELRHMPLRFVAAIGMFVLLHNISQTRIASANAVLTVDSVGYKNAFD